MKKENILLVSLIVTGILFIITCFIFGLNTIDSGLGNGTKTISMPLYYWCIIIPFALIVCELIYFYSIIYLEVIDDELFGAKVLSLLGTIVIYGLFSAIGEWMHTLTNDMLISILLTFGAVVLVIALIIGFFWINIHYGKKLIRWM